jgi:hypothetical protein
VKIAVTTIVPACKEIERPDAYKEASTKRHGLRPSPTTMSTTANHRFWQEAKRSSACHECTSGVWDPGKNSDSPTTAGLRQLELIDLGTRPLECRRTMKTGTKAHIREDGNTRDSSCRRFCSHMSTAFAAVSRHDLSLAILFWKSGDSFSETAES